MVSLAVKGLSKRYIRQWIFRDMDYSFQTGKAYAVTGPNGSGKSTLVKILAGFTPPTSGTVHLAKKGGEVEEGNIHREISIAAPYLDLLEDFTLKELLHFHFSFKKIRPSYTTKDVAEEMYLLPAWDKPVKHFSSGMKQRLKLGLTFYSESPILLLDEPTTNLDVQGQSWYLKQISPLLANRIVVVASNQESEYEFCRESLDLPKWKYL